MTEWISSDDRRNVLLNDIESRMAMCEKLIEQVVNTQNNQCNQVHQISKKIMLLTEHVLKVTQQLAHISVLLVRIAENSAQLVEVEENG